MTEKLFSQKVGDVTFTMQRAQGFHNHSEIALFADGAEDPIVIIDIVEQPRMKRIMLKPTATNTVHIELPTQADPAAPVSKPPTLSDVR